MDHSHTFWCVRTYLPPESQKETQYVPLYDTIIHFLSKGYAVVYAAENDVNQAVVNISKLEANAEDYIESGALKIINSDLLYSAAKGDFNCDRLIAQWRKVISSLRSRGFKAIMVMGMPNEDLFIGDQNLRKVVGYEECVAKIHDGSVRIFCCYPKHLVDRLPFSYLIRLLSAHQDIASKAGQTQYLISASQTKQPDLLSLIEGGLSRALGRETSVLVLKTMKLVYRLDQKDIVASPEVFEEKIKKMFGGTGEAIMKMVTQAIGEQISGE